MKDDNELSRLKKEIKERIRELKKHIWEIGERLYKASQHFKKLKKKGYKRWVEETFRDEFSYSTAVNYVRVNRLCPRDKVHCFSLRLLYLIVSPSFDDELREHILANAECFGQSVTMKYLNEANALCKNLEYMPKENPEIKKLFDKHNEKDDLENCIDRAAKNLKALVPDYLNFKGKAKGFHKCGNSGKIYLRRSDVGEREDEAVSAMVTLGWLQREDFEILD